MSSNKTVIPVMEDAYTEHSNFGQQNLNGQSNTCVPNPFGTNVSGMERPSQKPIIGFLYSISRSGHGEFWPLRIGSNSIGRAVGMYSGIFNNPFMIWGRYRKSWFKTKLTLSFQFHHTQMDGAHATKFLDILQTEINKVAID